MGATKKHIADRDYPGNGILTCRICGLPCRDHRIGRCPFADDVALFYGPSSAASGHRLELMNDEHADPNDRVKIRDISEPKQEET
jgi:hypothetical protein